MYVRTRFDSAHKMAAIESAMNHGYSNKVPIGIYSDYFVMGGFPDDGWSERTRGPLYTCLVLKGICEPRG